jgi:hypothetical protein
MWRAHDGVAVAGGARGEFPFAMKENILKIWIVFGVIQGIVQSQI